MYEFVVDFLANFCYNLNSSRRVTSPRYEKEVVLCESLYHLFFACLCYPLYSAPPPQLDRFRPRHFGNRQLELSVMRPYLCLQLIISLALLLCILLSDFGILFQSSNTTARILLHISTIILIASTVIQLHTRK